MRSTQVARLLASARNTGEYESLVSDLAKVKTVPQNVLFSALSRVAQSHPTNVAEIARAEAQKGNTDAETLYDAASAITYLWQSSDGESVEDIVLDLRDASLIGDDDLEPVRKAFEFLCPAFASSQAAAAYKVIGPPTLVDISGTVDLRCRFHSSSEGFRKHERPDGVVGIQPTIVVNLSLSQSGDEDRMVVFQMDENDLALLNRFTQLVTKELELAKGAQTRIEESRS